MRVASLGEHTQWRPNDHSRSKEGRHRRFIGVWREGKDVVRRKKGEERKVERELTFVRRQGRGDQTNLHPS